MFPLVSTLVLPSILALGPMDEPRLQQPTLRFQKSLRLPVKPKPVLATTPRKDQGRSGTVVEVHGDARPLEGVREQTLREFREWLVAQRFTGTALAPSLQPPFMSTAAWDQTHPGGFTVAPVAALGWGY